MNDNPIYRLTYRHQKLVSIHIGNQRTFTPENSSGDLEADFFNENPWVKACLYAHECHSRETHMVYVGLNSRRYRFQAISLHISFLQATIGAINAKLELL